MTSLSRSLSTMAGALLLATQSVVLSGQTADSSCVAQVAQETTRLWTPVTPAEIETTVDIPPIETNSEQPRGFVIADLWIDETGKVRCVHMTRSIVRYESAVTTSLLRWTFRPATLQGHAVAVVQSVILPVPTDSFPTSRPRSPFIDRRETAQVLPPPATTVRAWTSITPAIVKTRVEPIWPAPTLNDTRGTLILDAWIDASGNVAFVQVVKSIPVNDAAAVSAVRQWKFTPASWKRQPIAVVQEVRLQKQ